MKSAFFLSSLLLISCGTTEDATSNPPVEEAPKAELSNPPTKSEYARPRSETEVMIRMGATVRTGGEDCPVYLEVIDGDLFFTAYPVDLPEKFKKDGLKMTLGYNISRAPSPAGCEVDKVISVVNPQLID